MIFDDREIKTINTSRLCDHFINQDKTEPYTLSVYLPIIYLSIIYIPIYHLSILKCSFCFVFEFVLFLLMLCSIWKTQTKLLSNDGEVSSTGDLRSTVCFLSEQCVVCRDWTSTWAVWQDDRQNREEPARSTEKTERSLHDSWEQSDVPSAFLWSNKVCSRFPQI